MELIGPIERLQVQVSRLKVGEGDDRVYNPAAIVSVPALRLAAEGVIGLLDGRELVDVHHQAHPDSINRIRQGKYNSISFNFTGHYRRIQGRYGHGEKGHIPDGCGGENILIHGQNSYPVEAFARGLLLESSQGKWYRLGRVTVAHPCVPFSRYVLHTPHRPAVSLVKQTLQFLDQGTRGFLCAWEGEAATIHLGDRLWLPGDNAALDYW